MFLKGVCVQSNEPDSTSVRNAGKHYIPLTSRDRPNRFLP